MRASKEVKGQRSKVKGQRTTEVHISGAEGLYEFTEIDGITRDYFARAMNHPKGAPDNVVITIEKVEQKPRIIPLLPVSTVQCGSADQAPHFISKLLIEAGVGGFAIRKGIRVVGAKAAMHGAALITVESALRLEPDKLRGVRVSRLGIDRESEIMLSRRLARSHINTSTVKEAIILASKVASCKAVMAELCISDDPDYTTGYVASGKFGYVRIPNIKEKGSSSGGRVFFIREGADAKKLVAYLEKTPVLVGT